MKIQVDYDGKTYKTKSTDEHSAAEVVDQIYENMDDMTKMKLELEDGEYLILGIDALRRCVIRVVPTMQTTKDADDSALHNMSRDELIREVQELRQCLVNADVVARARHEYYGLCDCIDNNGAPYPSQWSHDLIHRAKQTVVADERLTRFAG